MNRYKLHYPQEDIKPGDKVYFSHPSGDLCPKPATVYEVIGDVYHILGQGEKIEHIGNPDGGWAWVDFSRYQLRKIS